MRYPTYKRWHIKPCLYIDYPPKVSSSESGSRLFECSLLFCSMFEIFLPRRPVTVILVVDVVEVEGVFFDGAHFSNFLVKNIWWVLNPRPPPWDIKHYHFTTCALSLEIICTRSVRSARRMLIWDLAAALHSRRKTPISYYMIFKL